jgi:signal transduction histidine kinase
MSIHHGNQATFLRFGLFCMCVGLALTGPAHAAPLGTIEQVRALSREEAVRRMPVRLDATVLYHDPVKQEFFLNDGTATCFANTKVTFPHFQQGTRLAIEGETVHIGLFPHFQIRSARMIGTAPPPEPYSPTIEELFLPELDSRMVRIAAVVTGVEQKGLGYTLVVRIAGYDFKADLPPVEDADLRAAQLMQRPVLLTGFVGTVFNDDMQMTGRHFFVGSFDDIRPTTSPLDEQKARPARINELLDARGSPDLVVRVQGVVTQNHQSGFYLSDDSAATFVHAAVTDRIQPGSRVEVVGFAAIAPFRPVLRAMAVRSLGEGAPPPPLSLPDESTALAVVSWTRYQNQLVRHDAELLGLRQTPDATILQCRSNNRVFDAVLHKHNTLAADPGFSPGDHLRLTGICELTTTRPIPRHDWIEGFRILLPGPEAVMVIRKAPWWTPGKLAAALGITAGAALLAFTAAALLKRQVSRQLQVISGKIRQQTISSERDRIARELHDTLEQNLTGLSLQIDGIDEAVGGMPDSLGRRIKVVRHMIRHTRSEARKSVWDLRSQILGAEGLAAALLALESLPAGSECEVSVKVSQPLPDLPPAVGFHVLRIAQEALTNAIKHAGARQIMVTLGPEPAGWRLAVEDYGAGFDPHAPADDDLPHFGFIGMHERASKIGGQLDIQSAPGSGCKVILHFPISHPPNSSHPMP